MTFRFIQLLILCIVSINVSIAQNGFSGMGDIGEVKKRRLIVMIEKPDESLMKKLARKPNLGSVTDYKADLEEFNENMKAVAEKFWPYNREDIQYKTFDEIIELSHHSAEFVVMACVSAQENQGQVMNTFFRGLHWKKDIRNDIEERRDLMCSMLVVNIVEGFNEEPAFYTPLFDVFPSKASIVCGLYAMNEYFEFRSQRDTGVRKKEAWQNVSGDIRMRTPTIAAKTLLIRSEWLGEELKAENLKNYYPYRYEVCDRTRIDQVVMESDSNYVFGVVSRFMLHKASTSLPGPLAESKIAFYRHYVIDASNGDELMTLYPDQGESLSSSFTRRAGHQNFTVKVISRLVEQIQSGKKY